jgi:hypothetical protein
LPEPELKDVQETEGRSSSRRRATRLPVAAALVVLLGLVLAVPLNSFRSLQVISADFSPIDGSWAVDLPARMGSGELRLPTRLREELLSKST